MSEEIFTTSSDNFRRFRVRRTGSGCFRSPPAWLKEELARHRVLFLDIETQRSAEEVGGWHNKHLMRVAAAVVYDSQEGFLQRI